HLTHDITFEWRPDVSNDLWMFFDQLLTVFFYSSGIFSTDSSKQRWIGLTQAYMLIQMKKCF
ncbi:hypothetical protein ACJX0J_014665, partial [Zea mays]